MNLKDACPKLADLADLLRGHLDEPALSRLADHVEACPACQEQARTIPPADTLLDSLRGDEDRFADNVPRELVEQLKQIPARESGARPAPTGLAFLAPPQQPDEIGRLGHYRILRPLGQGGMGAVFEAEDTRLRRQVALKVMLPHVAASPTAKERFLREARAAAALRSDHVVTIYQVDEIDGVPFLAMELLRGQTLDDVLRSGGRLDPARIIEIARAVAEGLAAAHEKGLVHRDIKPGNIWVETAGRVKILDFGLARLDQDSSEMTHAGTVVGTPAYMAPEQARGHKAVDARADLFSLGCVIYHLCTGKSPFSSDTMMGTLVSVVLDRPADPARLNPAIPPVLAALVMRMLEKHPARRTQSAREIIARLDAIDRGRPPRRGRRVLALGVALAALLGLTASVVFWETSDGRVVRIESNDPSIKVAFEDGELQVVGAFKEPVRLRPGKVGLRVARPDPTGGDFEFETDKLVVNRGDRIVLRIDVLDGRVQIAQAGKGVLDARELSIADADRRAAEWAISLGGTVQVNGHDHLITAVAGLPEARFVLTTITLRRTAGVTDAGLARLRSLQKLDRLELDNTPLTDAGLAHLADLKTLTWIDLSGTSVTDAGLAHLAEHRKLERLILDSTAVTDEAIARLKGLNALTHLVLGSTKVTDDALERVAGFERLRQLSLFATPVTDVGLARLTGLKRLNDLTLSFTRVTDSGLSSLKEFPKLETLHLRLPQLTDAGLARLKDVKSLIWLDVKGSKVTPAGLAALHAALPRCRIAHDNGTIEPDP